MSDNETELLQAALESYAARMSPEDFAAFTARVRPPDEPQSGRPEDPAARQRALMAGIAAKRASRPPVDANGYPLKPQG